MPNLLAKVCLACLLPVMALAQGTDDTTPIPTERIGPSVEFVEADTLPFDSRARGIFSYMQSELGTLASSSGLSSNDMNAMKILIFTIQPGERITFNMKSNNSRVMMGVYPEEKITGLKASFRRANMSPPSARAKKLIFTNTLKEPYEMSLVLFGTHGYKYHLTWERKAKK